MSTLTDLYGVVKQIEDPGSSKTGSPHILLHRIMLEKKNLK